MSFVEILLPNHIKVQDIEHATMQLLYTIHEYEQLHYFLGRVPLAESGLQPCELLRR
jgi:hypothetical protein